MSPRSNILGSIRPSNLFEESQYDLGTRTGWRQVCGAIATVLIIIMENHLVPILLRKPGYHATATVTENRKNVL